MFFYPPSSFLFIEIPFIIRENNNNKNLRCLHNKSNATTNELYFSLCISIETMAQNSLVRLTELSTHMWHLLLNRPLQHNSFNTALAQQLINRCQQISTWNSNENGVKTAVIISGQGRSFCSGADLKERQSIQSSKQWMDQHHIFEEMFNSIAKLKEPTIACVEGYALGK